MDDDRRSMLIFFGILAAFKIWTLILIFTLVMSWDTVGFLLGTHIIWIALILFLVWTPAIFWGRLLRMRARRRRLKREEWHVEESSERTLR